MIDCHVHAYPRLSEQLNRAVDSLAPSLEETVRRSVAPLVERAQGGLLKLIGNVLAKSSPPSGIERVAGMRREGPAQLNRPLETVLSAAALPSVAVTGALEQLLSSMERHGIERSVLIAAPPFAPNAWVLKEAMLEAPDRLIPVPMIPDLPADAPEPRWGDAFEELAEAGARGFKIHPNMDGLAPDNPAYRAMFEVAKSRRLFVILHTGAFAAVGYRTMRPADPEPYAYLFSGFPEVPVCLAHMNRDEPRRAWELMQAHQRLYTDTSWQPAGVIREAVQQVGVDRLLLGSDWPLLHPELQADALNELKQAVGSEDELERIGQKNAIEFLGEG